ncbi:MAG: transporter substrate-binding domain-containing protein, partial [Hyphomicrobium sp.]
NGLRVLPIAGEGATGNLRDLLMLKGVDLAILDSDILAHLDLTGEYPDARRRIRYVTHLFDQTVYLLARKDVKTIEALRGRKVAAGHSAMTAKTIFGLNRIEVEVLSMDVLQALRAPASGGVEAVVLSSGEITRLGIDAATLGDFHLLPVPQLPAVLKVYRSVRIATEELAGVARATATVDSVKVSTLLAVFDWTPQQSRYINVTTFIKGAFAALPELREGAGGALWRQVDVRAEIPGWTRYAASEPVKLLTPAQVAKLAVVDKPVVAVMKPSPTSASSFPQPRPVSMVVINRAPLADERATDGGLIPALLGSGLAVVGPAKGQRSTIKWSKADAVSLQLLTNETAADVLLPWDLADCERPNDLTQSLAMLCDRANFSDPIMQVVVGLFSNAGSDFKFDTDASVHGRSLCVPQDRDLAELTGQGRNWIAEKRITLVRQPSLVDCISAVQRREADAFVATDLEGWHLLKQFGIAAMFVMAERPLGTRTIHAAVWKAHPRATEMLDLVNRAIRQTKDSGTHASLVRQHLMSIWENKVSVR